MALKDCERAGRYQKTGGRIVPGAKMSHSSSQSKSIIPSEVGKIHAGNFSSSMA